MKIDISNIDKKNSAMLTWEDCITLSHHCGEHIDLIDASIKRHVCYDNADDISFSADELRDELTTAGVSHHCIRAIESLAEGQVGLYDGMEGDIDSLRTSIIAMLDNDMDESLYAGTNEASDEIRKKQADIIRNRH